MRSEGVIYASRAVIACAIFIIHTHSAHLPAKTAISMLFMASAYHSPSCLVLMPRSRAVTFLNGWHCPLLSAL